MSVFEPRSKTVRVYGGDYHDRLAKLGQRIVAASNETKGSVATLDETDENTALVEEYNALVAEAREHAVEVKVQQLPRSVAKALRAAHPPRKKGVDGATERDERNDDVYGVNEETFKDALVRGGKITIDGREVEYRSIVEPDLTDDDYDGLSDGAFTVLYRAALDLNYGFASDPKEISLA